MDSSKRPRGRLRRQGRHNAIEHGNLEENVIYIHCEKTFQLFVRLSPQ
jgi:hypothetical protein